MMGSTQADDVLRALTAAQRTPGWHNRNPAIRRFEIGRYGLDCTLYVVPARVWLRRTTDVSAQGSIARAQA